MSTKSMKRNMSINQRDNRLVLTKLSTNYNKVEKEGAGLQIFRNAIKYFRK